MTRVMGKPLLGHLLDRLFYCQKFDDIVVATSIQEENDVIEQYCLKRGIVVYRGSEEDVLKRLLEALTRRKAEIGVLIFGDGPVITPEVIDHAVGIFQSKPEYDFVGNDLSSMWPAGMEVEVFKVSALADSAGRCQDPAIREHGTLFIRSHPEFYKLYEFDPSSITGRPDLSFEVDEEGDLVTIRAILSQFAGRADASLTEIITFMDTKPELTVATQNIKRRWKKHRIALSH